MRRNLGLLAIIILCLIFFLYTSSVVNAAKDILLLEADTAINMDVFNTLEDYDKVESNIMDIGIYTQRKTNISSFGKELEDYHVYEVNASYRSFQNIHMVHGRFIWHRDIHEGRKFIVIEEKTAVELFATSDCIGKMIQIDGVEYQVVGVYRRKKSFSSFISATDKNRVYVPYIFGQGRHAQGFIVKVKEGLSSILEAKVTSDIKTIIGSNVIINNIDVKASKVILYQRLTFLLLIIILWFYVIRIWLPYAKNLKAKIKNEWSDLYLSEVVKKYALSVLLHLVPILLMFTAVYLITRSIRFDLLIDPDIIPSRLIDIEEWKEKLQEYIIMKNTARQMVSNISLLIIHISSISKIVCLILIAAFGLCIRRLESRMTGRFPNLTCHKATEFRSESDSCLSATDPNSY